MNEDALDLVDDHDRIYKPGDEDYRLPTIEDADKFHHDVLVWETHYWFTYYFGNVDSDDTWRRMPRGPEE